MGIYTLSQLFKVKISRGVDKGALDLLSTPTKYQFIGRTSANYGVQGYVHKLDFSPNPKNTFSVVQIGENVAQFRSEDWYGSQNLFLLVPNNDKLVENKLFITTCLNRSLSIYSSGYTSYPTLKDLVALKISLPIVSDHPDYIFMSDFIQAVQKLVIKDLVEWTDKRIEATKEVVANG